MYNKVDVQHMAELSPSNLLAAVKNGCKILFLSEINIELSKNETEFHPSLKKIIAF